MKKVDERFLVSPYLVFFLISSIQIGVGVLGFQRIIAKAAGYDSWISIIVAGMLAVLVIWMIYKIVEKSEGDIIAVHKDVFGKWIGGFLSLAFTAYLLLFTIVVMRTFIEVIQVWMFPEFNVWIFTIYFFLLSYYVISGGFRTVTGISLFSIVFPSYLVLMVVFPLKFANFGNLLPILDHSIMELAAATRGMSLSMIGYEVLFVFYPFIKEPQKSKKWAYLAVAYTTLLYLIYALAAFLFFSEAQLEKQIWATLSMWKIVELPFVSRFEYVGIASYILIILPNICLALWASSRTIKRLFTVQQRPVLIIQMIIAVIAIGLLNSRGIINTTNDTLSTIGFYFNFVYIPILFFITLLLSKMREKK
ncbi:GerAB/ArcD/ProY family transporter [Cytobacillus sp. S13-E01]|uniref:GerAB/ArcD/ProY family transporter n=1 Tax=Cytobacillus sp. S13-E01 TaxID=3031326 RepID=UPI0023D7CD5B|nr:GerAB/ArcD/ProY family transporter [Cytobacillus sp. S13-E01]MDF0728081.1 GerAB/ArcD/ProY family transporter [Cytobacillus sp. S13-E01]